MDTTTAPLHPRDTRGRRFQIVAPIRTRRWDVAVRDAEDRPVLLPIEVGMRGVVDSIESHGSAPYTRLVLRFNDGTFASGVDPAVVGIYR